MKQKNKIKLKPAKGFKHLEDLSIGSLFKTSNGIRGILLECDTNAHVLITDSPKTYDGGTSFALGKTIISAKTEVKEIK